MAELHETGKQGEALAVAFLKSQGYHILETNWRSGNLEVDIIASKDQMLAIVEVKTRRTNHFGEPEEFVNRSKQKNLVKAANHYIISKNLDMEARFDIISILYNGAKHKIFHIQDAFYPTL